MEEEISDLQNIELLEKELVEITDDFRQLLSCFPRSTDDPSLHYVSSDLARKLSDLGNRIIQREAYVKKLKNHYRIACERLASEIIDS